MSNIFQYEGKQLRTVIKDNEPWFVANDVCEILEFSNPSETLKRLDEDEVNSAEVIDTLGRKQITNVVNEAGLYNLILGSRKPEARQFKRWVTHEVLPAIRKTGSYIAVPKTYAEALRELATTWEREQQVVAQLEAAKPKIEFFDAVADSKTAIPMADAAKVLAIPGIGRNKLFEILRREKILMNNNRPYQEFVDRGYFRVIEQKWNTPSGDTQINIKTLVYQKGLDYIRRLLTEKIAG